MQNALAEKFGHRIVYLCSVTLVRWIYALECPTEAELRRRCLYLVSGAL